MSLFKEFQFRSFLFGNLLMLVGNLPTLMQLFTELNPVVEVNQLVGFDHDPVVYQNFPCKFDHPNPRHFQDLLIQRHIVPLKGRFCICVSLKHSICNGSYKTSSDILLLEIGFLGKVSGLIGAMNSFVAHTNEFLDTVF